MVAAHDRPADADALLARVTAERAVLKPAISGGAYQTVVLEPGAAVPWTDQHRGDFLVQAFVDKIEEAGEWSLTCFGGAYSHAVRKTAAKGLPRAGRARRPRSPRAAVLGAPHGCGEDAPGGRRARRARSTARLREVDLVEVPYGPPPSMELELIEPELFLRAHDAAPRRFAKACLDAL